MHRTLLAAFALVFAALVVSASPAGAAEADVDRGGLRITISGGVVVTADEVVDGPVVSIDGPATIDGTVNDNVYVAGGRLVVRGEVSGDILVVKGNVLITGRVGGDIIALDGRITTLLGAQVNGDVTSRKAPSVAPGTVRGEVNRLSLGNVFAGFLVAFLIFLWIAVTVSVGILGLLFVLVFPRG